MKKVTSFKKGFTLIELLLYVGLSSVLLISIFSFMAVLLESRIKNQTIAEVEQQGLQVMQLITQTIRNADNINSPTQGNVATSVSLNTITAGLNPTTFDISGNTIFITEGGGSAVALTNSRVSVGSLTFTNLSRVSTPGIIEIQFTISYVNNSGKNEYNYLKTFTGSASLRQP
jgi:Tfp pilus assembly protein PilW